MRPALLLLCVLAGLCMLEQGQPGHADETDWQDCLACHNGYDSGLPSLSAIRPLTNALLPSRTCLSCHDGGPPDFFAGDWSHPVRSIGEHIGCVNCHPPVAHSAGYPPPRPRGDYKATQCYVCHSDIEDREYSLASHLTNALTRCIDCHPPHQPMRALLPDPLLTGSQRDSRGKFSSADRSNSCMACHFGFDLFNGSQQGFVTLNTENYHRLHVIDNNIGCIECHDPHGSNEHGLIRSKLLTGELLSYLPTGQGASCSITCHGAEHVAVQYVNRLR